MNSAVNRIPNGINTVVPVVVASDASKAVEFYVKAFGAQKLDMHYNAKGALHLGSIRIGNSVIFVEQHISGRAIQSSHTLGGSTSMLHIYFEDVDAAWQQAISTGANPVIPVEDVFWGERYGQVVDPFGNRWSLSSRTHNLNTEEVEKGLRDRLEAMKLS